MNDELTAHALARELEKERLTYTVDEAAALLGISRRHTWRQIAQGRIPVVRFGRRTLISRAALAAVLNDPEGALWLDTHQGRLHAEGSFAGGASGSEALPRPQAGEQAQRQRSDAMLRVMR